MFKVPWVVLNRGISILRNYNGSLKTLKTLKTNAMIIIVLPVLVIPVNVLCALYVYSCILEILSIRYMNLVCMCI